MDMCSQKSDPNVADTFAADRMVEKLFNDIDRYHKYFLPIKCLLKVIHQKYHEFALIIRKTNEAEYIKNLIMNIVQNRSDSQALMMAVFSEQILSDPSLILWSRNPILMQLIKFFGNIFEFPVPNKKINTVHAEGNLGGLKKLV
ncbi:hypothetical protein RF11_06495 [Thelohanellus kitauei]|uniref:Uncharacterized protein n=1 Tax=Thelohanellus kitauei TaxID=669202 RepID=A0A0C2NMD6_THEKT|nr:hypothetical protein RF11_06495 [Thelohanellus kitauei]